jgi:hypothetical protein
MTRKLKALGMVLLAALALTAASASAASAANFTSSTYPTTGTGISENGNSVFTTEGGTAECKTHYEATLAAASSQLAVKATVSNCKAFGFVEATVTGCAFTFTEPTGTNPNYTAKMDIVSPCTVVASTCHITVPNQGPLSNVAITNLVTSDVSVKANVTGINYNVLKDGFLCPFNGTGGKTGATYMHKEAVTFDAVSPASAAISVS